ncbi:MAG: hypothetical protein E7266_02550 [Lachnospiraceae bacterium]|nr:hypothetical protein [Lachnospiraceae bacterium]
MNKYDKFRKLYKTFTYKSYDIAVTDENIKITYNFSIDGLADFAPQWTFKNTGVNIANKTFETMVFSLGMVELVSYWKIACPKEVIVEAGSLDECQIKWWKDQYFNGLGEFFYTNGIELDPDGFMNIISTGKAIAGEDKPVEADRKVLVPVGGGKDSVVSMEIIKNTGYEMNAYIINPRGATENTARIAGFEEPVVAGRTLDKEMLRLNKEGYLNGHTPFSAIVAFSSIMAAYLNGQSFVALSNESSANESTVKGSTVNHQYSKSFKFELDFNEYEKKYIGSGIHYFSMLRPLSEFQIAGLFAGYKEYHKAFRSCNAGSKQDIWCGHCPKCLFVFIILSPFMFYDDVVDIFGTNMLDDVSMEEDFKKLIGLVDEKPFECVGSRDEINLSLVLTINKMDTMGIELPTLLKYYRKTGLYDSYMREGNKLNRYYDENNLLPEEFDKVLKEQCILAGVLK